MIVKNNSHSRKVFPGIPAFNGLEEKEVTKEIAEIVLMNKDFSEVKETKKEDKKDDKPVKKDKPKVCLSC